MTVTEEKTQAKAWYDAANGRPACLFAEVRYTVDRQTGSQTVKGLMGIAPNDSTVILYPISVYRYSGCDRWNKAAVRRIMTEIKLELLAGMKEAGYDPRGLHHVEYSGETETAVHGKVKMCEIRD